MVLGNISGFIYILTILIISSHLALGPHGCVGYLQPGGRVSSPSSSSSILQHLKVLHLRVHVCFVAFELCHLLVASCSIWRSIKGFKRFSGVVYPIFVFNTHPINRISKVGAAIANTISSLSGIYLLNAKQKCFKMLHWVHCSAKQNVLFSTNRCR